jgi:hypothetical protein
MNTTARREELRASLADQSEDSAGWVRWSTFLKSDGELLAVVFLQDQDRSVAARVTLGDSGGLY